MEKKCSTPSEPETEAMLAFGNNIKSIRPMVAFISREAVMFKSQASRLATNDISLATKQDQKKLTQRLKKLNKAMHNFTERITTLKFWTVVMMVTCVEAYLQDLLTAAARVDPNLMCKSEQSALYADIIAASSLESLANELRRRWAQNWLNDGGPTRWISRLTKMGVRRYPSNLAPQLERFWGIRHIVVHAAGVATADFVRRHPGMVKAAGDHLPAKYCDLGLFLKIMMEFVKPTESFFLARHPSLGANPEVPKK